jgi:hypothetical protein
MTKKGSGWLRFLGVAGLYLIIGVLIVPTLIAHWLGFGGLWVIEIAKAKADELRGRI